MPCRAAHGRHRELSRSPGAIPSRTVDEVRVEAVLQAQQDLLRLGASAEDEIGMCIVKLRAGPILS
jgi:hypothetical protein